MNKHTVKTFFTTVTILFFSFAAQAQTDEKTQVETMTIFGPFTPTIKLTPKIERNPEPNAYVVKPPAVDFEMKTEAIHSAENTEPLAPEPLPKETAVKYPHNYLILGFGNYITPYGEFYANTSQMDNHAFGIHLKHVSSQGGIKDYADNSFSHNLGDVFYKFSGKMLTVKADVFLKRDVVHYYGFNPDNLFDPSSDSIKQRYFLGGATVSVGSNDVNPTDFGYLARLKYYNLSDRFDNQENSVSLDADFRKGFFLFNTRTPQKAGANIDFAYFNNNIFAPELGSAASVQNDIRLGIRPYFECDWSEYRLKVGIDAGITRNDDNTDFYLHPVVEATVKVIQNRLYLFARLGGSIERNSFLSLTDSNPFIAPGYYSANFSDKKITAAGGFSAMIAKGFDMKIGGEYARIKNMPFFISRPDAPTHNFYTLFDKASQTDLFLESNYTFSNKIHIGAGIHYYITQPDSLEYAYYHPDFKMTLSGKYRLMERLLLGAEFYLYSKMWAANPYNHTQGTVIFEDVELPACYDLNLSAEYRIWQELYLFLQANNVFAQNYERYLNYPTQGLNVLGGIRFRF
jgi:hypothetical protein